MNKIKILLFKRQGLRFKKKKNSKIYTVLVGLQAPLLPTCVYVAVQFYSWFKFCFPLLLGMVMNMMNDNEFEAKENEIYTKDKIEPQHIQPRSLPR